MVYHYLPPADMEYFSELKQKAREGDLENQEILATLSNSGMSVSIPDQWDIPLKQLTQRGEETTATVNKRSENTNEDTPETIKRVKH